MRARQSLSRAVPRGLPDVWLLSDARNDRALEQTLRSFAVPVAFVFRHYHLPPEQRFSRYRELRRICRDRRHIVILADGPQMARDWGADGIYGSPEELGRRRTGLIQIATAHDLCEVGAANRLGADAVMISPVFPTRSHPGARTLGPLRFRFLAQRAAMPVIALGGMDPRHARRLGWRRWAAIDGLSNGEHHPDS